MNDLESRIAERLRARETDAPPPSPDLALKIGSALVQRRRQRRIWAAAGVAGVAAATAAAVVVPLMFFGGSEPSRPHPAVTNNKGPSATTTPVPTVAARTTRAALPARLARLFPGQDSVVIDRRLADGSDFRAMSVASNGVVAGLNQAVNKHFFDHWDSAVLLDLRSHQFSSYPDADPGLALAGVSPASDGTTLMWGLAPPTECRDLRTGTTTEVGAYAYLDDGHVVSSGDTGPSGTDLTKVAASAGCAAGERLGATGTLIAVGWPWIYLVDGSGGYFRVNAGSGRRETVPRPTHVPADLGNTDQPLGMAAHGNVVAWQLDGRVMLRDLSSGASAERRVPVVKGINGTACSVTVGDRFVAYGT